MRACKRFLAALTLLLAALGLLLSLAAGVGVWVVKRPVTAKATWAFGRVEAKLDVADDALDQAEKSLARAAERLDGAREEQRALRKKTKSGLSLRRGLARVVGGAATTIAPELGNAHDKLHTVAEAAVVVNTVLEDVGAFPPLATSGLNLDSLKEMNDRLAEVGPSAWELSRLLGEPKGFDPEARLSRVDQAVKAIRRAIIDYRSQVTEVRQRTEAVKARTFAWITPAAILISAVCFWIALSQLSLLSRAWSWWKQPGPQT
jgi:hypothetical protein